MLHISFPIFQPQHLGDTMIFGHYQCSLWNVRYQVLILDQLSDIDQLLLSSARFIELLVYVVIQNLDYS